MNKNIVIIGAGITGLTTAHWLKKDGYNVTIIEPKSEVGGSMVTEKDSGYLMDFGPNSGLETTPLIKTLVEDLNLQEQFIYGNKAGNKRYILKGDKLHALPMNPKDFFSTKLFSTKAKFRLGLEPFIGKSKDGYYQSISQFVIRRLGREFLDYAINPFVAGVFAGDPDKLSVKSALFPMKSHTIPYVTMNQVKYRGFYDGVGARGGSQRDVSIEHNQYAGCEGAGVCAG